MSVYIKREGRLMEPEQVVSFRDRIAALEAENAALWSVVLAYEELEDGIASFELRDEQVERLRSARAALIQHKAKS
jgi:uncharacterized protein YdcH (DUF465 family)